jgi:hypothetical protein
MIDVPLNGLKADSGFSVRRQKKEKVFGCYQLLFQVIEKLVPPEANPDGRALSLPALFTIVMGSFVHEDIVPVCPPIVAWQPLNCTVPKFASGSTPPDHGASAIHSAEYCLAL